MDERARQLISEKLSVFLTDKLQQLSSLILREPLKALQTSELAEKKQALKETMEAIFSHVRKNVGVWIEERAKQIPKNIRQQDHEKLLEEVRSDANSFHSSCQIDHKDFEETKGSLLDKRNSSSSSHHSNQLFDKNAVKILKQWLMQHINDPYPTNSEKAKLAQQTGLSLKQVNHFFS